MISIIFPVIIIIICLILLYYLLKSLPKYENSLKINYKRYFLYLIRWQLSTPILAFVPIYFHLTDFWTAAFWANIIGGLIFFWVDNFIFTSKELTTQWEIQENIICSDCGKKTRGYRIVKTQNYDKTTDKCPKFRCESCSITKTEELKNKGIKI